MTSNSNIPKHIEEVLENFHVTREQVLTVLDFAELPFRRQFSIGQKLYADAPSDGFDVSLDRIATRPIYLDKCWFE